MRYRLRMSRKLSILVCNNIIKAVTIMSASRLKLMQAVGLVLNDDFLVQYNMMIDTSDVIDYIKDLTWDWTEYYKYLPYLHFDNYYGVEMAEIIGPLGVCYTFNIKDSQELFHLNGYFEFPFSDQTFLNHFTPECPKCSTILGQSKSCIKFWQRGEDRLIQQKIMSRIPPVL